MIQGNCISATESLNISDYTPTAKASLSFFIKYQQKNKVPSKKHYQGKYFVYQIKHDIYNSDMDTLILGKKMFLLITRLAERSSALSFIQIACSSRAVK